MIAHHALNITEFSASDITTGFSILMQTGSQMISRKLLSTGCIRIKTENDQVYVLNFDDEESRRVTSVWFCTNV
jgi:hypothetical protein